METTMLDGIRWVLFDAVGTLIFAHPPVADVYRAAGRRFGSQRNVADIHDRFCLALAAKRSRGAPTTEANERDRWRRIVNRVIDDVGQHGELLFEQLWQHFAQPEHWRTYDDVAAALAELRRRGYRLAIASNFDLRLKEIVAGHPTLSACEAVFVSSEIGFTKPDLRFFRTIEERLAASPAQIALVGDDQASDVQGATAAGWRAIRLNRSGTGTSAIQTLKELL